MNKVLILSILISTLALAGDYKKGVAQGCGITIKFLLQKGDYPDSSLNEQRCQKCILSNARVDDKKELKRKIQICMSKAIDK